MILEALIAQFQQRFQHEKRAQVCLWFDDKGEFAPLLPAFREHLSVMLPPPFVLLEYDPDAYHGQIWLKHRVYTDLAALGPEERKRLRYVFYLPLSEDRFETPDDKGAHHLELLAEYRITGVLWRLAGKRPTLFSFLRHAGVKLPDNPSDQRRLYDGGRNSLLAKYIAKFVNQPSAFWNTLLTTEVAQSRLIGDVEQTILDLGVSPETTWQALQEKGLTHELVDMVRERYGFEAPTGDPALWIRRFVESLALTETYLGYNEPVDFPFAERLPPLVLRQNHVQLLQRWLRDAESRPAWDRWITEVETHLDLSAWAEGKHGLSFSLPHLVAQRWQQTLASKYVKPDEREAVKSAIKQYTSYEVIDKISVQLVETHDKYWARLANLNLDYINIEESEVRSHDRLLMGGIWAEITLLYDDSFIFRGQNRPFWVEHIRPIQLSSRNIDNFIVGRKRFTRDQWLALLLRSMGYEPSHPSYTHRQKFHHMMRLVPFVEKNFNLVELGPRGTGKSFVYQQMSPYCHLVSGGQTTTAQMFVNLSSGQRGLVCLWDVVAFDEAAGIRFPDRNGINIMKGYMEDGAFSRGRDMITAEGSVVFVGNLDGTVETIVRTSHLFYPMPKEMDTAFYDRIHAYVPGWEFQKTRDELYTNHFGLVTDYLTEVFRELRKSSYVDYAERAFHFGSHLGGRDQKAVRKIVSGLIKLLHPDGEVAKEEMEEYLAYAMEMRRRVKEQLKKMGGLEYWDTSFSYIDRDLGQETFVPVPEMGGGSLIVEGSLAPGGVYSIGTDMTNNRLALFLLQAQMNPGSGRIIPLGNLSNRMKEASKTADAYLKANVRNLGIDRDLKGYDFSIQAINLNQAKEGAETAVAFFISMVSAILDKPLLDRTVVLGEMSVQGMLLRVNTLPERMQLAVEAGAKRILIPSENKRDLADVPDAILTAIQWQFYDSPTKAAIIAMGMN